MDDQQHLAEITIAEARGRREAYEILRRTLTHELTAGTRAVPPGSQPTYAGGLARARRIVESLYRGALIGEEDVVIADGPVEVIRVDERRRVLEELVALAADHARLHQLLDDVDADPDNRPSMLRAARLLRVLAAYDGPLATTHQDQEQDQ